MLTLYRRHSGECGRLSLLLGHSNSRITAKHYNPWVQSRQVALESEIAKAWQL